MSRDVSEVDRIGDRYEEHHRNRRAGGESVFVPERLPFFVAAVGGLGRRVLDLGCRSGAVTMHFLEGNDVTGVDVDPRALERTAERGVVPVRANVEDPLPFGDGAVDVVVAGELLEHVRDPAGVVAEVLRGRPPEDDPTHLHMYSPSRLRSLLESFDRVDLHFVGGRYRRLHARLLARDLVFVANAPA